MTQYARHSERMFSRIPSVHVAGLVRVISHASGYFDNCDIAVRGNFGIYFQAHFYCKHAVAFSAEDPGFDPSSGRYNISHIRRYLDIFKIVFLT
jgi:hypothetical protein